MFKEDTAQGAPDPIVVQSWFDELQRLAPTP